MGFKRVMVIFCSLFFFLIMPTGVAWANSESYENLKGTNPSESFEDLMFLKEELKGKTVVGVGESTHGTGSFFQFKDRLFRFLVEEMGFRAFGIEVQMSLCDEINRYVQTGEGNIESIVEHNTHVFATRELLALIEWMREYNKTAKEVEKVRFYGFDVQDDGRNYGPFENYYRKVKSSFLNDLKKREKSDFNLMSEIVLDFEKNREAYTKGTSVLEFELIKKLADNKKLSLSMNILDRDEEMKNNVLWIQNYERTFYNNEKIMLWGHNAHISKGGDGNYIMGNLLFKEIGEEYYSLGLDFYSGRFNTFNDSLNPVGFEVTESSKNILSGRIHSVFEDEEMLYFKVTLALKDPKTKEIFEGKVRMYFAGWKDVQAEYFLGGSPYNIEDAYDGLVYFKEANESHYINKGNQPEGYKLLNKVKKNSISPVIALGGIFASILLGIGVVFISQKGKKGDK